MSSDDLHPTLDALLAETQWVRALARSLVVDPGTADDVAQDAAVIALTKPPSDAGAVRGWFRRVVKNLASNARRGESRRGAREESVARPESDEAADETVARWEVRRQVVEAVLGLDEPYRTTILLRFFDGLTAAQAAVRQGVPLETVRTRTRRGLELLRGRLAHLDDRKRKRGMAVLLVLARRETDLVALGRGVATGSAVGGAAMASATKWIGAAAFLALFGGGLTWAVLTTRDASERHESAANATLRPAVPVKVRRAPPPTDASEAAAPDGVDLDSCDRERDLFGVVVGPDGRAVAGARVQALRWRPYGQLIAQRGFLDPYTPGEETKSGFDGTFALRLPPRDSVTMMRVAAEGFALWESAYRQAGERVRVTLSSGMTLTVAVKSHDGAPVPDADVSLSADGEPPGVTTIARRRAATGPDGTFRVAGIARKTKLFLYVASARHPAAMQRVEGIDAPEQTVEVVLPQGRRLLVSVTDRTTGAAVAGAEIGLNSERTAGTTGPDGRVEFDDAPKDHGIEVSASASGYARKAVGIRSADAEAKIALDRAAAITGRVLDAHGRPVRGADVVGIADLPPSNDGNRSTAGTSSGDDGRFTLDGLASGVPHVVRVRVTGWAIGVTRTVTPDADPRTIDVGDVRLVTARTVRGRVVDADGAPAARIDVVLTAPDRGNTDTFRDHRRTDDLGRFAFADLPPGAFTLTAAPDAAPNERESVDVVIPESRDPLPVTIHLGGAPEKVRTRIPVRARVTDEDGNPVAGIQVQFGYAANGATSAKATGDDGAIEMAAEHEPQAAFVHLSDEQARTFLRAERVWLPPGRHEAIVTLRRGRTISGKVVDEDDRPVIRGGVTAWTGAKRVGGGATNDAGRFAFAVPLGARVDLQATPQPEPRVISRSAGELRDVEPGAADLVIRVVSEPAKRAIDVEVVDDAGTPVAGAWIQTEFRGEDWEKPLGGSSGTDGHLRIESLPRTPVVVSATIPDLAAGPNHHWTPQAARVSGDEDTVRIVVPKPRVLRGRVVGEDGAPVAGAVVHASPGTGRQGSMTIAGPDGRFEIRVPPDAPLPYPLRANPFPPDQKKPLTGWDLVEAEDREYEIVVHPVPVR